MRLWKWMAALVVASVVQNAMAESPVLIMGFKDEAKMPLMGPEGDNSGALSDLFGAAARRMGYELKVVRLPKVRLYKELAEGNIDFYPAANYTQERAGFSYFFGNGFTTRVVAVTRADQATLKSLAGFNGKLLAELGNSTTAYAKTYTGLTLETAPHLNMDAVQTMLNKQRADIYIADIEEVLFYKKTQNFSGYDKIGLKVHMDAIAPEAPMYTAFSMKSKYFAAVENPGYNPSMEKTPGNFPVLIKQDCVAKKLADTLETMRKEGESARIYQHYFGTN